jgi:hypothetical protein
MVETTKNIHEASFCCFGRSKNSVASVKLSLEKSAFELGETIIGQIEIRNTGESSLDLANFVPIMYTESYMVEATSNRKTNLGINIQTESDSFSGSLKPEETFKQEVRFVVKDSKLKQQTVGVRYSRSNICNNKEFVGLPITIRD